ncbi:MAG: hypothetical protein ACOC6M_03465 [Halobacteriota archaeon]
MKKIMILLMAVMILGCAGEKDGQNENSKKIDFQSQIAVFKDDRSWKAQITFTLPNPCHKIEFEGKEVSGQKVILNYKHTPPDPEKQCAQVIKTYNETVNLGELEKGSYTILLEVNDRVVKQIDITVQDET